MATEVPANLRAFKIALGKAIMAHNFRAVFDMDVPDYLSEGGTNAHIDAASLWCDAHAENLRSLARIAARAAAYLPQNHVGALGSFMGDVLDIFPDVDEFLRQARPQYIQEVIAAS